MKKLLALTLLAMIMIVTLGSLADAPVRKLEQMPTKSVTVSSGDTLWSIARQCQIKGIDTRIIVSYIKEHNDSSAVLRIGQELEVPYRNKLAKE